MSGTARPGRFSSSAWTWATAVLIGHWAGQGRLPHLAALRARGTWLDLDSTAAILHTSAWPTFATGSSPGRHGVYYPYQPRPGYQQAQFIAPDQYGTPTFWALADQARRRCPVYDVPETFPDPGFGGRAIFDWGTWAHYGARAAQLSGVARRAEVALWRLSFGPGGQAAGPGSARSGAIWRNG